VFEIDGGLSSQYVSALLMLAACGESAIDIKLTGKDIGARGYVDLTLACMQAFGAEVEVVDDTTWRIAPTGYRACDYLIEPDASAATYLWAAEVLTAGKIDLGVAAADFTQPDAQAQAYIAAFPNMPAVIDPGRAGGVQQHPGAFCRVGEPAGQGVRSGAGAVRWLERHSAWFGNGGRG
jgi:3-phosphoshikimate 1-carboxyvinyltransferase